jgi:hypothetical protein
MARCGAAGNERQRVCDVHDAFDEADTVAHEAASRGVAALWRGTPILITGDERNNCSR